MEKDSDDKQLSEFRQLENERKQLEAQIITTRELLNAYNVGMAESLVDAEGFPRSDVDVYNVRHKRVEIIRAENDYKNLMKKLEDLLTKYHSQVRPNIEDKSGRPPTLSCTPKNLAIVKEVKEESPSFLAGMKKDDAIIEFGGVNSSNFKGLQDINKEVQKSVNSYIKIIVKRDGQLKRFNLKPRAWSGNGLLGCFLVPAEN